MKKLIAFALAVLMALTLLAACGSSSYATQSAPAMKNDYAVEEMAPEAPAAMDSAASSLNAAGETGTPILPENRKWIVTVHMDAETEDLDALISATVIEGLSSIRISV